MGKFHAGELAVQAQAGVQVMARRVGQGIQPFIFDGAADFFFDQKMAVIASLDTDGHMWASLLTGAAGFMQALDSSTMRVTATIPDGDPLRANLQAGQAIGIVAINFADRARVRLNGTVVRHEQSGDQDVIVIDAQEVYGNCQKYIQARSLIVTDTLSDTANALVQITPTLTADQQQWIERADTFFIASAAPEGGADASHRGGNAGFIAVVDDHTIIFPDYSGNMMFNTLGNLTANPAAGLLFIDFEANRTLQITGPATIIWNESQIAAFPGAQRTVKFVIEQVIENRTNHDLRFGAPHYSRFNPDLAE